MGPDKSLKLFSLCKIPITPGQSAFPTTSQISSFQRPVKESIPHRGSPLVPTGASPQVSCLPSPSPPSCAHLPLMTAPTRHFLASPPPTKEMLCRALAWQSVPQAPARGTSPISCLIPHMYEVKGAYLPPHGVLRECMGKHSASVMI